MSVILMFVFTMEELIKNKSDTIRESAYNRTLCGKEAYREFLKLRLVLKSNWISVPLWCSYR